MLERSNRQDFVNAYVKVDRRKWNENFRRFRRLKSYPRVSCMQEARAFLADETNAVGERSASIFAGTELVKSFPSLVFADDSDCDHLERL
jgi:hypothetical protein